MAGCALGSDAVCFCGISFVYPVSQQDGAGLPVRCRSEPVCFARAWWEPLSQPGSRLENGAAPVPDGSCSPDTEGLQATGWERRARTSPAATPTFPPGLFLGGAGCASPPWSLQLEDAAGASQRMLLVRR